MPPKGWTKARILSGCPSLDRGSREAEVGFEPRTFRRADSNQSEQDKLHLGGRLFGYLYK
ncbi:hypothetical protein T265_08074 [Opisthorchis viverrini]|uniref:Uncharacterized protein n=1 Tax=Opisthorchis viverrini TaxID=6198 RepID=A0A074ZAD3_OPIVI|nr:hypothetical protein T265_08074 [Opisthorchis viverrini]KER24231.1 hypothetical protein T265_08074 [Opisthorchis viverrini]